MKYLGILITSDLRWNDHISKIVGLAILAIGYILFKEYLEIALKLSKKLAIQLWLVLFWNIVPQYGAPIWSLRF